MILLDTHAWIWWTSQSPKLLATVRAHGVSLVTKDEAIRTSGLVTTVW
jgi:PIN domain nuclease of toxin-antitoxin system